MWNWRLISLVILYPKSKFRSGLCLMKLQRITSTPILSAPSLNAIELPQDLCIALPSSPKMEEKHRLWCSSCRDWKVFTVLASAKCDICGTDHVPVKISSIPVEKVEEQRKRYTEFSKRKMVSWLFSLFSSEQGIIESSAGILQEKRLLKKKREEEREKMRELLKKKKEFENQTREVGRNQFCICGSGKKFKNCCQKEPRYLKEFFS